MPRNMTKAIADVKVGDRIRLIEMADDPDPLEAGATGTVTTIHAQSGWTQLEVDWDCGRQLMLASPPDRFEVLDYKSVI